MSRSPSEPPRPEISRDPDAPAASETDRSHRRPQSTRRDPAAAAARAARHPRGDNETYALVIPEGTQFVAVLNNDLSTAQSREGDRFTMTVRAPGAI